MGIREVKKLLAELEGDGDDEGVRPGDEAGPADAKALSRTLAGLKRAWDKATVDERSAFVEWAALAPVEQIQGELTKAWNEGYEAAKKAAEARAERAVALVTLGDAWAAATVAGRDVFLAEFGLYTQEQVDQIVDDAVHGDPDDDYEEEAEGAAPSPEPVEPRNGFAPPAPNGHADDLAARVAAARNARGWSQKQLAEAAGTNPPVVSDIERGKITGGKRVARVLDALGLTA